MSDGLPAGAGLTGRHDRSRFFAGATCGRLRMTLERVRERLRREHGRRGQEQDELDCGHEARDDRRPAPGANELVR